MKKNKNYCTPLIKMWGWRKEISCTSFKNYAVIFSGVIAVFLYQSISNLGKFRIIPMLSDFFKFNFVLKTENILRLHSSGMWRRVICSMFADVWKRSTASICRDEERFEQAISNKKGAFKSFAWRHHVVSISPVLILCLKHLWGCVINRWWRRSLSHC
jgi:hypothetical protein